jgi:microcystin-dependent protein
MGLVSIDGSDDAATIDTTNQAQMAKIDQQTLLFTQGALGSRPPSTPQAPGVEGRTYYATDERVLYYDSGTDWIAVSQSVGDMKVSCRKAEHGGWIAANGRSLPAGTYPQLRAVLIADGNPFGVTGGNPIIPDLRQRTPVGAGGSRPLGQVGGAETHTLVIGELAYHAHGGATNWDDRDHAHQFIHTYPGYRNNNLGGSGVNIASWHVDQWEWTTGRNTGHLHGVYAEGGNWAHNNMQPFTVVQWFIFAGPAA